MLKVGADGTKQGAENDFDGTKVLPETLNGLQSAPVGPLKLFCELMGCLAGLLEEPDESEHVETSMELVPEKAEVRSELGH